MAWALGGNQQRVDTFGSLDLAKMDVEPVRAHQDVARLQILNDLLSKEVALDFIGQQDIDHVRSLRRFVQRKRLETMLNGQVIIGACPVSR